MINKFSSIHVIILFSITILFNVFVLAPAFRYPLTNIINPPMRQFAVLDLAGYLLGARRFVADISWIQTMQYYGSPEESTDEEESYRRTLKYIKGFFAKHDNESTEQGSHEAHHNGQAQAHDNDQDGEHEIPHRGFEYGIYGKLSMFSYRTAFLDPFFDYSYLYSAGSLAWNLKRPEEAVNLLKYGLRVMEPYKNMYPKDNFAPYWRFNLYISAIAYKQGGKIKEMTSLLEEAVALPNAPNMVKVILANIYEKDGNYVASLKLWLSIYDSNDKSMASRAVEKITTLRALLKI